MTLTDNVLTTVTDTITYTVNVVTCIPHTEVTWDNSSPSPATKIFKDTTYTLDLGTITEVGDTIDTCLVLTEIQFPAHLPTSWTDLCSVALDPDTNRYILTIAPIEAGELLGQVNTFTIVASDSDTPLTVNDSITYDLSVTCNSPTVDATWVQADNIIDYNIYSNVLLNEKHSTLLKSTHSIASLFSDAYLPCL